jgi:thiosulfate/3-mercaptopyruvate sulfurtransferase
VQYRVLPHQQLAVALAALGINEKTPVVVYGDGDRSWGGEGWNAWVLSWLGHKGPIRLLNGGIQSWRDRKLPLVRGSEQPVVSRVRYQVSLNPGIDITTEELARRTGTPAIVDVRSTLEWLKGRIPGAVHIPWDDFHTGKERRPLPPSEVKKLLAQHGIAPTRPVVYYCAGGIRSAYAWLVHELSGLPHARNYEGGMAAWKKEGPR